ncbi:MAG: YjfB family protein [Thiomicrospira sp.]|nr:YjfB family protein [Thiomicrospira sp.]
MAQSQVYAKQEAQVTMLKKSMDAQTDAVMTLLEGIAPVPASKLPANLGQNINTTA